MGICFQIVQHIEMLLKYISMKGNICTQEPKVTELTLDLLDIYVLSSPKFLMKSILEPRNFGKFPLV